MLLQIIDGLEHLHSKCKILHNDIKGDNVVLSSTLQGSLSAVIIDFGKACEISQGKKYNLSNRQKEYYKINHPHIAPDLRDGISKQSSSTDVYSFGRIIKIVANASLLLKGDKFNELAQKCMQYNGQLRPDILSLKSQTAVIT